MALMELRSSLVSRSLVERNADLRRQNRELHALLRQALAKPEPDGVTIDQVKVAFVDIYAELGGKARGIPYSLAEISQPGKLGRSRDLAWPRHVCISLCYALCSPTPSKSEIGRAFRHDRSVVEYALERAPHHLGAVRVLKSAHERTLARFEGRQDGQEC